MHDKGTPLMHTWRYQQFSVPKTTTHNHALGMFQVPAGYKWNMDFCRKDSIRAVMGFMAELGNFQNGALMVNPCYKQSWGSCSHGNMVGFNVTIHASSMVEACNVANLRWQNCSEY